MGYANPFHAIGFETVATEMTKVGADGLICVDLPPEEDIGLREALHSRGLSFIRLTTPTTRSNRMQDVLANTSGFVYHVSTTGVTGSASGATVNIEKTIDLIRGSCALPVAVGFGVKTPDQAREIAKIADGVVVGSAIIDTLEQSGSDTALDLSKRLAQSIHQARRAQD